MGRHWLWRTESQMSATFVVYTDESGDEGFSFGRGSSEWFVLSAIITRKAGDLEVVKLIDRVRTQLGKPPKKPLHFRDLKHEQRLPLVDAIAKADLRPVSVLVHKPSLGEREKFQERYRLYFHALRHLFERVSWCCRDHRPPRGPGDGTAEMVLSNRSGMSYAEMGDYLAYLGERTGPLDVRVDWSVIAPERIAAYTPGKRMGLQIADAVASSFFYAVQPSQHGFTEDRYARMLRPVVYHRHGQYGGYGLKLWPQEMERVMQSGEHLRWMREEYK